MQHNKQTEETRSKPNKQEISASHDSESEINYQANSRSDDDRRFILKVIRYSLQLLLIVGSIFISVKIFPFFMPIFFGLIIAKSAAFFAKQMDHLYAKFLPCHRRANQSRRIKLTRTRSIVIYFILVTLFFFLIGWGISSSINSLSNLAQQLPKAIRDNVFGDIIHLTLTKLDNSLKSIGLVNFNVDAVMGYLGRLQDVIINRLPQVLTKIVNTTSKAVGSLPLATLIVLITIMSGYYFLVDASRFYLLARRTIPSKTFVRRLFNLFNGIIYTLFRIVGGYLLILLVVFLQAWLGLSIVGFPNAAAWAIIIAFVDMLPVLGISATMIPMSIYLFVTASSWQGVLTLIIMFIMWTSRRFFEPLILGGAMSLHPLLTILAMILGIKLYGLGGVLIGPVVLVIIREIMQVFDLNSKIRTNLGRLIDDSDAYKLLPPLPESVDNKKSSKPRSKDQMRFKTINRLAKKAKNRKK